MAFFEFFFFNNKTNTSGSTLENIDDTKILLISKLLRIVKIIDAYL